MGNSQNQSKDDFEIGMDRGTPRFRNLTKDPIFAAAPNPMEEFSRQLMASVYNQSLISGDNADPTGDL